MGGFALHSGPGLTPCYAQNGRDWTCDWQADGYRLPTEAEWEYACRGGRQTPWFWGSREADADHYAWYAGNAQGRLHPVGQKRPNPFGLHDLAGNCWEWCWDRYDAYQAAPVDDPRGPATGGQRVLRGGSFNAEPWDLRSASRFGFEPELRLEIIGFRCVRSGAPALGHSTT